MDGYKSELSDTIASFDGGADRVRCAKYIGFNAQFTVKDFSVAYDYLGGGYGIVSDLEREAIRLLGGCEGVVLDPVYTGRSMGAMIDLIRKKTFRSDETVLFWHTGGAPALFAYAKDLI